MAKSTIVSIVPVKIEFRAKGAMYPDAWDMPEADDLKPEVLHIEDGWTRIYLGVERGYYKTTILSAVLAKGLVDAYIKSCIGYGDMCQPGVFTIPDKEIERKDVERACSEHLTHARICQSNWYEKLIKDADNDWSRSGHSHRSISDLQRRIAKKLRLDKEWLHISPTETPYGMMKCPACVSDIETKSIVCKHCHLVLKPEEYKKYEFAAV